ncbi:MAG: hypothetical protein ABEJ43_05320 [Haloferacaceae archaeon]
MTALSTLTWLVPAGAVAGLAGAVAMDIPMGRHPEGWTPAFVAASVLRRADPESVRFRDANAVHHGAGVAAGVLYALFATLLAVPFAGSIPTPGVGAALPLGAHLLATLGVVGFIYAVFAHLVLPRAGDGIAGGRTTAVRGQWFRSAVVFGAALAVVVPAVGWAVG